MFKTTFFYAIVLLQLSLLGRAQEKVIDTVYLFDRQFDYAKKNQKITTLNESDLLKNTTNISEVLRFQSPVFIKENGRGMVASPAFRGTTAQQTAVVWNGININSMFLGQGDLNNLGLLGYDQLEIKSGGGSVIYGSSAIGGTVHLNNELAFNRGFNNELFGEYGSFKTYNTFLKSAFSNEKLSVKLSANYSESENKYEVPQRQYTNLSGEYYNKNINLGFGYRFASQDTVLWQSQLYSGAQHYPVLMESAVKPQYLSDQFRSLISWNHRHNKIKNVLNASYLEDEFRYFSNMDLPKTSGGIGKTYLIKNDFSYQLNRQVNINIITEYQLAKAEGYRSGIDRVSRNSGALAGLLRWTPSKKLYLEAGAKKDFVEQVNAPFLFSISGNYQVTNHYTITFNGSKNFRYPSFNDLYWKPGGNPDLKPEIAYQGEIGNKFRYGNFAGNITPYYIRIQDMIRWLPNASAIWTPVNTEKVESYGVESQLDFEQKTERYTVKCSVGYVYTHSKDLGTGMLLSYVPQHKWYGNASFRYRFAELFVQALYNGLTYTTTDESMNNAIQPYFVANTGIDFTVFKHFKMGFKVRNLFNEVYETMAYYPLPLRNYTTSLLINF